MYKMSNIQGICAEIFFVKVRKFFQLCQGRFQFNEKSFIFRTYKKKYFCQVFADVRELYVVSSLIVLLMIWYILHIAHCYDVCLYMHNIYLQLNITDDKNTLVSSYVSNGKPPSNCRNNISKKLNHSFVFYERKNLQKDTAF